MKDKRTLEAAYNDADGVTARFNLNLLARINREMNADFDLSKFKHEAVLNKPEGRIELTIRSLEEQHVHISDLDLDIAFQKGERIHTENSHKYRPDDIDRLCQTAGLDLEKQWLDTQRRFSLNLFSIIRIQ